MKCPDPTFSFEHAIFNWNEQKLLQTFLCYNAVYWLYIAVMFSFLQFNEVLMETLKQPHNTHVCQAITVFSTMHPLGTDLIA